MEYYNKSFCHYTNYELFIFCIVSNILKFLPTSENIAMFEKSTCKCCSKLYLIYMQKICSTFTQIQVFIVISLENVFMLFEIVAVISFIITDDLQYQVIVEQIYKQLVWMVFKFLNCFLTMPLFIVVIVVIPCILKIYGLSFLHPLSVWCQLTTSQSEFTTHT